MIVDRIYKYLDGKGVDIGEHVLKLAMSRVHKTLTRNLGVREDRKRRKTIGGSTEWYCPRRAYYSMTGAPKERYSARSRIAFLMGDILQAVVDICATQAGVEFAYPNTSGEELELDVTIEGVRVVAHIDHALKLADEGLVVFDSKSMADHTFYRFEAAATDPLAEWRQIEMWGYVAQLRFYMWLVELTGLGTGQRGAFIGINKNTGHMAELWVDRCEDTIAMFRRAVPGLTGMVSAYDRAAATVRETVLAQGGSPEDAELACEAVPRIVDHGLPPRPVWARTIELPGSNKRADGSKGPVVQVDVGKENTGGQGFRCSYCPFTELCYPGFEPVYLKGGPKYRKALETS